MMRDLLEMSVTMMFTFVVKSRVSSVFWRVDLMIKSNPMKYISHCNMLSEWTNHLQTFIVTIMVGRILAYYLANSSKYNESTMGTSTAIPVSIRSPLKSVKTEVIEIVD